MARIVAWTRKSHARRVNRVGLWQHWQCSVGLWQRFRECVSVLTPAGSGCSRAGQAKPPCPVPNLEHRAGSGGVGVY